MFIIFRTIEHFIWSMQQNNSSQQCKRATQKKNAKEPFIRTMQHIRNSSMRRSNEIHQKLINREGNNWTEINWININMILWSFWVSGYLWWIPIWSSSQTFGQISIISLSCNLIFCLVVILLTSRLISNQYHYLTCKVTSWRWWPWHMESVISIWRCELNTSNVPKYHHL